MNIFIIIKLDSGKKINFLHEINVHKEQTLMLTMDSG